MMIQTNAPAWTDLDALEDLFMAAGDGNRDALATIAQVLRRAVPQDLDQWPADLREFWLAALELVLEPLNPEVFGDAEADLFFALLAAGYDTPAMRDMAANHARAAFVDYLDPAGLLQALGVHAEDVPVQKIAARWRVMQVLAPGVHCWEPANGHGQIIACDDIANEVSVHFSRRRTFPLGLAVQNLVLIEPGSPLAKLLENARRLDSAALDAQGVRSLCKDLVSTSSVTTETLRAMLVPAIILQQDWLRLDLDAAGAEPAADATIEGPVRRWDESRSVPELADLLGVEKTIPAVPAELENVTLILQAASERDDQAQQLAEVIARLWHLTQGGEWLQCILRSIAPQSLVWTRPDVFAVVSEKIPGKATLDWFRATAAANGAHYLANACMQLPLRLWAYVEKTLQEAEGSIDLLFAAVQHEMQTGVTSADLLLWLWRTGQARCLDLLDNTLIFRTLAKPVRGAYLKANRDLRKLLLESPDFQTQLMKQGDPEAVTSFVRCVKHMALLDSGERQSLLVKIVRLFPDARSLVEEKRSQAPRKAIGRITSIRSFRQRHDELQDIINRRIPDNSRAIAHARSYGDLRENAEFKAAKEEQAYLAARRAELEQGLHEVKTTDFNDVVLGDTVVPGCSVELQYSSGESDVFHLLGLWDSVPEKHILSYEAPLGQLLLGSKTGDRISMPSGAEATIVALHPLSPALHQWVLGKDAAPTPAT